LVSREAKSLNKKNVSELLVQTTKLSGGILSLLRWIKAQWVLQKTKNLNTKNIQEQVVKGTDYGSFLAIILLFEATYTGLLTYARLELFKEVAADMLLNGSIAEPNLWIFIPLIGQVVLVMLGAISLFRRKAVAVIFLGVAMLISLIGICYLPGSSIQWALIYIGIARVLPLAAAISLLRNGRLG